MSRAHGRELRGLFFAPRSEGEHSLFFGTKKPVHMLRVRGYKLVNTLDMGGPDDDLRSDPVVGGLS
jgi:hypothetical protein